MMDYDYDDGKFFDSSKMKDLTFKVKGDPGCGCVSNL